VNLQLFAREGTVRINNTFYVTRCSAHNYFTCSTAYISVSEALRADRARIAIYMILSGLTGAFLGLAGFILYRRNHSLEQQLRRAIRKDKLRLVYQPIVALPGRQIAGAEALVRWTDEEGFAVNPEVFVKIAEERGFVREITRTVVRNALRDFGEILRTHPDFRLSINVAAADLTDPGFLPMLDRSLERSGIAASKLIVEITESSTALHEEAIETTRQLRRRGHRVHIDDFGTGYSSLSYLQDLSVDAIKIDRTFTQAIGTEAVTVSILPQILAMAEALDLDVIVEGVETVEQASYFADARRPVMAQGWLFGRPVSAEEFHRILTEREKIATASVDAA
jgi:sensor c-di-GMP phosphodiesterase-like protein